jgi:hypothetical protein
MSMTLKLVNVMMFVVMIIMNYLANAIPIGGKTTGELSNQYPNLFVPAGITFSIWGVIYLLLLLFVLLQFRDSFRPVVLAIGWAFAISCLLNAAWIVAWHYEQLPLSLIIMLGLLVSLIWIGWKIEDLGPGISKMAFGIYLGWISIATIANVTALLVNYNWGGWGLNAQWWTVILIVVGLAATVFALIRLQNPFVGLAVIWAFTGIIIARTSDNSVIVTAAFVAIGVMVVFTMWQFIHPASLRWFND